MNSQNQTTVSSNSLDETTPHIHFKWQDVLWAVFIVVLFFAGVLIELAPEWSDNLIHITITPGHGFTTQEAVAMIPVSLAVFLVFRRVWKYRPLLKQRILENPMNAFGMALIIGLGIGLLMGIGVGVIFDDPIIDFVHGLLKPIGTLFFG